MQNLDKKTTIKQMIKSISEKNFAEANKYLKSTVDTILREKIAAAVKKI